MAKEKDLRDKLHEDEMFADPEPPDFEDEEGKLEDFEIFKGRGIRPEELFDKEFAVEYAAWLKANGYKL